MSLSLSVHLSISLSLSMQCNVHWYSQQLHINSTDMYFVEHIFYLSFFRVCYGSLHRNDRNDRNETKRIALSFVRRYRVDLGDVVLVSKNKTKIRTFIASVVCWLISIRLSLDRPRNTQFRYVLRSFSFIWWIKTKYKGNKITCALVYIKSKSIRIQRHNMNIKKERKNKTDQQQRRRPQRTVETC